MSKEFMTYDQQINKLKNEKGLFIGDETHAKEVLKRNSYYSLISGYKEIFKNKITKKYKDGVCFEDIESLYEFDRALREVFLNYILKVETQIKSLISYSFCEKYGEQQQEYLQHSNYEYRGRNKKDINKLIGILGRYVNDNEEYTYINHARKAHNNIPLWVLMNALTFGNVSVMYKNLTQDLKIKISREYKSVNESQLESLLKYVVRYRNVCAHGERLFSYRNRESIPNFLLHEKMAIEKKGAQYKYGKHDLFAVVIALKYMLGKEEFVIFKNKLAYLLMKYFQEEHGIARERMLAYMGFPENWASITRYRKT